MCALKNVRLGRNGVRQLARELVAYDTNRKAKRFEKPVWSICILYMIYYRITDYQDDMLAWMAKYDANFDSTYKNFITDPTVAIKILSKYR